MTNAALLARDPDLRAAVTVAVARALEAPADWPESFDVLLRTSFTPFDAALRDPADALADAVAPATASPEAALETTVRHTRIFIGPPHALVTPVASEWRPLDPLAPTALLEECGAAYAEAGLDLSTAVMPVDHVVVQFEFLHYLAWTEAAAEDAASAELWKLRQSRFWARHMAPWLPEMSKELVDATKGDPVYAHSAALLAAMTRALDPALQESLPA